VKQQNWWTFATVTDKETGRPDVDVAFLKPLKHATSLPYKREFMNPRQAHPRVPLPWNWNTSNPYPHDPVLVERATKLRLTHVGVRR
jgi:hypothetical protein